MPQISIIVPVYNVEKYLSRCIDSILSQTFKDFELILVNDGSADHSGVICDKYAREDSRIKVIHKKNGGASSARNVGLAIATGNYFGFVDSDDWIHPNMYEYLFNLIKRFRVEIAACDFVQVSREKKIKQPRELLKILDRKEMLNYFFRLNGEKNVYTVCNKLIDKKIFYNLYFKEGIRNEDVEINLSFFLKSTGMILSNQIYYFYFKNYFGVTKSPFIINDMDLINAWDNIILRVSQTIPDYIEYAKINRKRADFTLLSKMILRGFNKNDPTLVSIYYKLKVNLRNNLSLLLKWKMPLNRKILMICLCLLSNFKNSNKKT